MKILLTLVGFGGPFSCVVLSFQCLGGWQQQQQQEMACIAGPITEVPACSYVLTGLGVEFHLVPFNLDYIF